MLSTSSSLINLVHTPFTKLEHIIKRKKFTRLTTSYFLHNSYAINCSITLIYHKYMQIDNFDKTDMFIKVQNSWGKSCNRILIYRNSFIFLIEKSDICF